MSVDNTRHEFPDPTPVEVPIKFQRPETLEEKIKRLVRSQQFAAQVAKEGFETEEEADDFDVGDDIDPTDNRPYDAEGEPAFRKTGFQEEMPAKVEKAPVEGTSTPAAPPLAATPEKAT